MRRGSPPRKGKASSFSLGAQPPSRQRFYYWSRREGTHQLAVCVFPGWVENCVEITPHPHLPMHLTPLSITLPSLQVLGLQSHCIGLNPSSFSTQSLRCKATTPPPHTHTSSSAGAGTGQAGLGPQGSRRPERRSGAGRVPLPAGVQFRFPVAAQVLEENIKNHFPPEHSVLCVIKFFPEFMIKQNASEAHSLCPSWQGPGDTR